MELYPTHLEVAGNVVKERRAISLRLCRWENQSGFPDEYYLRACPAQARTSDCNLRHLF
jgi:hypothetical protein